MQGANDADPRPGPGARSPAQALRHVRRLVVLVVGATVLALGGAMLVLPGPGIVGVAVGLSILATEFAWARRLLKRAKSYAALATSSGDPPGTGDADPKSPGSESGR